MKTVTLTEFRSHASGMLTEVEQGKTILILRHGRPIAEVSPVVDKANTRPSWKEPALRLSTRGSGLSSAILEDRKREDVS